MIFCSRNEKGEPAWKLILDGRKTVTRRLKPVEPGKILAVCPNRCKRAVGHIKVISCDKSINHFINTCCQDSDVTIERWKQKESSLEGFESWDYLRRWLAKKDIELMDTFRIEFKLIKEN